MKKIKRETGKKETKKAKKVRNAKNAGKVLRDGGLGRRFPSGSAESGAGPINQVNKVLKKFEDKCNYIYICLLMG